MVASEIGDLPDDACYRDEAVATITLHPRYVAKSDWPERLLAAVGLRAVGSRARRVSPSQWGIEKHQEVALTEEIFVAGSRSSFKRWADGLQQWTDRNGGANDICHLEDVGYAAARDKLQGEVASDDGLVEVVLHNSTTEGVVQAFVEYAGRNKADPLVRLRRDVGGLTFIPVATEHGALELARFSFVRIVRSMPRLRTLRPVVGRATGRVRVTLPDPTFAEDLERAAVFDGGIPDDARADLAPWVTLIEPAGIGPAKPELEDHGLAVTGALLFGPAEHGAALATPLCSVDHVRVLDTASDTPGEAASYVVLDRIVTHLRDNAGKYALVNISLGPEMAIEDDEVSLWTSTLDTILAPGGIVASVATGNDGDLDRLAGLHRIQPPSDGVNVLSVGAADRMDDGWNRAGYSSFGPGRSPGLVKPDGLAFGGDDASPFGIVNRFLGIDSWTGTSLAAPFALRSAAAVRAQLGDRLTPLAIRALLIHRASSLDSHDWREVGWGRFESSGRLTVTCDDDEAVIVYQGHLPTGEHLRLPVPMPTTRVIGSVTLSATLVIASEVDAEHAASYTRSGLEVSFRPNSGRFNASSSGRAPAHAKTEPFFSAKRLYGKGEAELRADGHKWEPCLRSTRTAGAETLKEPCFDIYYHTRQDGKRASSPQPIQYAFILGLKAPSNPTLYDDVVRSYAQILVPLRPQMRLQIPGAPPSA
jgi:hypothetical protein